MASKWAKLRGRIPAFENESSFQEKVNTEKLAIIGTDHLENANVAALAALYATGKAAKDALEDQVSGINIRLEALSQMIVEALEGESVQKVELSSGATVYLQDTPYPGIEDEDKFYAWLHREKMDALLSLNHQTLKGIVSERLQAGKALPPGTKCFLKTQARIRNGNSQGDE